MEVAELQVAHDGWPLLASLGLRSALLRRRRPRLKNPLLALDRTKRSLSLSLSLLRRLPDVCMGEINRQ